jgi:hypothetical protein
MCFTPRPAERAAVDGLADRHDRKPNDLREMRWLGVRMQGYLAWAVARWGLHERECATRAPIVSIFQKDQKSDREGVDAKRTEGY